METKKPVRFIANGDLSFPVIFNRDLAIDLADPVFSK